jgi:hypothetical protein
MSLFNWLLGVGAVAAIVELLWWIGVVGYLYRYRFANKKAGDPQ